MEEKVVKIGFFKKVWYSITKFEQYPTMAMEGLKRAIKYLIILTAIVTIFITFGSVIQTKKMISDLTEYVQNNIPEFSYTNGILTMEKEETIVIEDIPKLDVDKIIINTLTETEEQKTQIEKDNIVNGTMIFFFKDEIVLEINTESNERVRQTYTYNDFVTSYAGEYIESFDKADFLKFLTSDKMNPFYLSYGTSIFISLLMVNILVALLDAFEIAILGLITTTVARIRMKFVSLYNIAIYSLTLPMILNILYIIINYFTNFTITYFQVAYITIAYIYLAAAIFILKDDFITKMQEVEVIKQEQLKVRKEIKGENEKKENEEDESEEKGSLEDGQG